MDAASIEALTARLQAEYTEALQRAVASVPAFLERLAERGAVVYYDPTDGSWILVAGEPGDSAVLEVDDTFWLLVEPDSGELIGLEIPDLAAFYQAHPRAEPVFAPAVAHAMQQPGTYVRLTPASAAEAGAGLREVVPA